jgi:hypothetical protein
MLGQWFIAVSNEAPVSDESATLPIYIFRKMTSTERRVTPRRIMKTAADQFDETLAAMAYRCL